jgi:hypothetical protein
VEPNFKEASIIKALARKQALKSFAAVRPMIQQPKEDIEAFLETWIGIWERAAFAIFEREPHDQVVSRDTWLRYLKESNDAWVAEELAAIASADGNEEQNPTLPWAQQPIDMEPLDIRSKAMIQAFTPAQAEIQPDAAGLRLE